MNEQIDGMVKSISEASQMKGIQWNRVTWLSWWLAVFLFVVVVPFLAFYIGNEYGKTMDLISSTKKEIIFSAFKEQMIKHNLSSSTSQVPPKPVSPAPTVVPTPTPTPTPTDATGMHCGGFIKDAPTCPANYHCQLKRIADLGGSCVRDK